LQAVGSASGRRTQGGSGWLRPFHLTCARARASLASAATSHAWRRTAPAWRVVPLSSANSPALRVVGSASGRRTQAGFDWLRPFHSTCAPAPKLAFTATGRARRRTAPAWRVVPTLFRHASIEA
jgi:hypothetical protein